MIRISKKWKSGTGIFQHSKMLLMQTMKYGRKRTFGEQKNMLTVRLIFYLRQHLDSIDTIILIRILEKGKTELEFSNKVLCQVLGSLFILDSVRTVFSNATETLRKKLNSDFSLEVNLEKKSSSQWKPPKFTNK